MSETNKSPTSSTNAPIASAALYRAAAAIDDPADWPQQFAAAATLDALLRCPVCGELLRAPLIFVPCLHSACALCVRRRLATADPSCPVCLGPSEAEPRPNRLLDDIAVAFVTCRIPLLRAALNAVNPQSPTRALAPVRNFKRKRPLEEIDGEEVDADGTEKNPKSIAINKNSPDSDSKAELVVYQIDDVGCRRGPEFAYCTWCRDHVPGRSFAAHTSVCAVATTSAAAHRIPTIHLHTQSDSQINAMLSTHRLPCTGTRAKKTSRLREWIRLFNANLDARPERRLPVQDLRKQLIFEEDVAARSAAHTARSTAMAAAAAGVQGVGIVKAATNGSIKSNGAQLLSNDDHAFRYKSQFDSLAAGIKRRMERATKSTVVVLDCSGSSSDEDRGDDGNSKIID